MSYIAISADFIKQHEGMRFSAYQDGGGVWTIGVGHVGPEVIKGLIWDQKQIEDALSADMSKAASQWLRYVTKPMTDNQAAALTSLVFNIGIGAFAKSKTLQFINSGDWINAVHEWLGFDHDGGKEVKGLLLRRLDECAMFLRGT